MMLKNGKVLVVLDPEQEQQPALDKVLALAKVADFEITLFSCEYTQYLVEGYYFDALDLPALRQELLAERKATLERLAGPLRDNGLTVETRAVWGHPAYEIVTDEASRIGASLIVAHTRQHSAVSRMLLTHNDWQLVRTASVPLLLVKERDWQSSPVILAAVDPKHARHKPGGLDHRILDGAMELSSALDGATWAVHSFAQLPLPEKRMKEVRSDHQSAFDLLMSDYPIPSDQQILSDEAPEFALAEVSDRVGADIVVMGAISRSMLSDVFIGNTTEKVLDFLPCDVLIIKPGADAA